MPAGPLWLLLSLLASGSTYRALLYVQYLIVSTAAAALSAAECPSTTSYYSIANASLTVECRVPQQLVHNEWAWNIGSPFFLIDCQRNSIKISCKAFIHEDAVIMAAASYSRLGDLHNCTYMCVYAINISPPPVTTSKSASSYSMIIIHRYYVAGML